VSRFGRDDDAGFRLEKDRQRQRQQQILFEDDNKKSNCNDYGYDYGRVWRIDVLVV
jgi:hypothetical protein